MFSWLRRFLKWITTETPAWTRFYVGLLLGGVVGVILTIFVLSGFLFQILQGLVAAGTLGLAAVTSYVTVRDRREALRRELADRVYVPMRQEALDWQNPESEWHPPSWGQLNRTVPYLTMKVPADLKTLFDREEAIEHQISIYSRAVYDFIQSQTLGAVGTITREKWKDSR
jgi:hypothetical protein